MFWIVIGALWIIGGMRLFAWDHSAPFYILDSFTAFVYLPAWIIAVVAVIGRRYVLAAAALAIVVLQVVIMLPELAAAEPVPAWAAGSPTIGLLDANVYAGNQSMAGYASQIKATHPSLVTMEEASPADVAQLDKAGALAGLPYRIEVKRYDPRAFFVASKYPLVGTSIPYFEGLPLMVETTVKLPTGDLPLWVVHTTAPTSYSVLQGMFADINHRLQVRGPQRLLLVGDFNATWGNRAFRNILATGMTDGAAARGHDFDMTWSQTKPVIPPLVRIDHVLTGSGVTVTQIQSGPGPGSDHRDLHATIAIER